MRRSRSSGCVRDDGLIDCNPGDVYRRIHVSVEFPEPGAIERERLWSAVLPPALPVDPGLDLADLAQRYPLTGAQIRDATLDAAYLAAADGRVVTQAHLLSAIRRQYEKAGRTVPR